MHAFVTLLAICGVIFPIHAAPTTASPPTGEDYLFIAGLDFGTSESQAIKAFDYVRNTRDVQEVAADAKQNVNQYLLEIKKFVNSSYSNVYAGFALIKEEMKPDGFDYCYEILTTKREFIQSRTFTDISDIRSRLLKVLDDMTVYHNEIEVALDKYKEVCDLLISSMGCFESLLHHYDENAPRTSPTVPGWNEMFEVFKDFVLN